MKTSLYTLNPLGITTYLAKAIPSSFGYHIDRWLIDKSADYADAKRISPVMWMYMKWGIAFGLIYLFNEVEKYSFLLTAELSLTKSKLESILEHIIYYWNDGHHDTILINLMLPVVFLFLAARIMLARYPTPVRFNKSNQLVYTKIKGKVWVMPWGIAKIKLWRFSNHFSGGMVVERAIAVRLFSLNRKGELLERWEPIGGINNLSPELNEERLGGDPTLLYWHWLNDYMFDREVPEPEIGKISLFEKLHFRSYKFPKNIDALAVEMHERLQAAEKYPSLLLYDNDCSKIPNDPHFTYLEDFPHMEKPQYQIDTANRFAAEAAEAERKAQEPINRDVEIPDWQRSAFEQWRGARDAD